MHAHNFLSDPYALCTKVPERLFKLLKGTYYIIIVIIYEMINVLRWGVLKLRTPDTLIKTWRL